MHSIVLCAIVILLPVTPRLASQEPNLTHVAFGGITHDAYLKATNAGANDRLGAVLALSGDTLIVGVRSVLKECACIYALYFWFVA